MTYVVSFIEVVENCLMNNDISKKIRKYPESGGENPVFLRQNVYYIKSLVTALYLDAAVLS